MCFVCYPLGSETLLSAAGAPPVKNPVKNPVELLKVVRPPLPLLLPLSHHHRRRCRRRLLLFLLLLGDAAAAAPASPFFLPSFVSSSASFLSFGVLYLCRFSPFAFALRLPLIGRGGASVACPGLAFGSPRP